MSILSDGLYFIARDRSMSAVLSPDDTDINCSATPDVATLLTNLNTPDSCVWRFEAIAQESRNKKVFSIRTEGSAALALDVNTLEIYLDDIDTTDEHQLWTVEPSGFIVGGPKAYSIKNKFASWICLGLNSSDTAVGVHVRGRRMAHQWYLLTLASWDEEGVDDGEDASDTKENRDWLRDMLWYFSRRYGRARDVIGYYPYEDSHIDHPNSGLRASGGRHF